MVWRGAVVCRKNKRLIALGSHPLNMQADVCSLSIPRARRRSIETGFKREIALRYG